MRHQRTYVGWRLATRCAACLLVAGLLAGCGAPEPEASLSVERTVRGASINAPEPSVPALRATVEGDGNLVNISPSGDLVVVDVHSPSGIGTATVDWVSGPAPANIIVRLHLRGLESFRLAFDHTVIAAEVSSDEHHNIFQRVELPDGSTQPIASDSPHWLDIQIDPTSTPLATLPQPGSFAIRLPHGIVNEQRHTFTLRWIDFYR